MKEKSPWEQQDLWFSTWCLFHTNVFGVDGFCCGQWWWKDDLHHNGAAALLLPWVRPKRASEGCGALMVASLGEGGHTGERVKPLGTARSLVFTWCLLHMNMFGGDGFCCGHWRWCCSCHRRSQRKLCSKAGQPPQC